MPNPKKRENIRVTDQISGDQTLYIVADVETGRYYRFAPFEYEIFSRLDGQTPLEKIKESVEAKFDVRFSLEQLEAFVEDLNKKELLEGSVRKPVKAPGQSLFYYRLKAFNPERLLDVLVEPLSFAFKPAFVVPSLFLIVWSLGYSYSQRVNWLMQEQAFLHGWGFLLLFISVFAIGFVHETGHSLTCRHYGGRVKEMGFILIYLMIPGFYANVSDAYLFRDKWRRACVGMAGLFFQFTVSALFILVLIFSIPGSLLSNFIIGMVSVSGVVALWNFNPLIKLDGYYVLGDILEVTNLRADSQRYLGLFFQELFFNLPDAKSQIGNTPKRLKKIYLFYGILCLIYTAFILWLMFKFLLAVFIRKLAAFGVVLAAGGIVWGIWNWYKHAGPGWRKLFAHIKEDPELRMIARSRLRILGLLGAAAFLVLLWPSQWGIKGTCDVHPAVKRALAPLETGVVARVDKSSGEKIGAEEVFASLDDFNVVRELASLTIDKRLKEERLETLKADYGSSLATASGNFSQSELALQALALLSPQQLEESRNAMEAAQARYLKARSGLSVAQNEWRRYQTLRKEELVSPKEAEEKQSAYESALQEYLAAEKEYAGSAESYRRLSKELTLTQPEKLHQDYATAKANLAFIREKAAEIKAAHSELEAVKAQIATDEAKLDRLKIRSPISGIIMTPYVRELKGRLVNQGQAVAWVYRPGPMIIAIRTDELNISEVPKPADAQNEVSFKILAIPGKTFTGKVMRVIPESLSNLSGKSYLVDVAVDDPEGLLLPGMQGTAKFYGKRHPFVWQLIRRPVKYVFWKLWSLF